MNANILFMGTPHFAAVALKALLEANFNIIGVVSQPDKKSGRGQKITKPETKVVAEAYHLPVFQPNDKEEIISLIKNIKPDLVVVSAYGKIIPQEALEIPKFGFLNIHGSLLPKYRGSSCIAQSILNGDEETGISIMKLVFEMDAGPTISQVSLKINNSDTSGSLTEKLAELGAKEIIKVIPLWIDKKITEKPQPLETLSVCKLIKKEDAKLDWNKSAEENSRKIRAYNPWPIAYALINGKTLRILEAEVSNLKLKPGQVDINNKEIYVGTGDKSLKLTKLQIEGKKIMTVSEILNGYRQLFEKNTLK